jgi:predicted nucleic acid-binding protein
VNLLLDTSALLVHFYKEPGGDRVQELLADESNVILISSVSITELARRLVAMGYGVDEAKTTSLSYASLADRVLPVDTAAAVRAFELSSLSRERIPLTDALIAACASIGSAALVHRDAHFRTIPTNLLQGVDL